MTPRAAALPWRRIVVRLRLSSSMYFLDGTGFFSLICLLIQCILAWICAGLFLVLSRDPAPWLVRWRRAFVALGLALTAISIRFLWAQWHVVGDHVVQDGELPVRFAYGVYVGGKVAFVWFLVGGIAALRERRWPSARWAAPVAIGAGFVLGFVAPTIEVTLLLQVPLVALAFASAWRWLRPAADEPHESGRRIVRAVLGLWAVGWVVHGVAVAFVGPLEPAFESGWNVLLRLNSLIDLSLQVPLAVGLMVIVVHDGQQRTVDALRERDRLREQVERAEKLRSLSTLVGGIAHELNNPLTAILGFAEDLGAEDPQVRRHAAQVVTEQADRCRVIVQRMSALGRQQPFVAREQCVADLVRRVVSGLQPQARTAGVRLDVDLEPGEHAVAVDGAAIEQVLTNLLANALQASPRGGRVVVGTRTDGALVRFFVDDSGAGVPVADRGRIFEPFWTSKHPGAGTGIGLAVADTVVRAHRSHLEVGDGPLGGARFTFALPWHAPVAAGRDGAPEGAADPADGLAGATLQVLVVDDERDVRAAIRRHLELRGFRVSEAADGARGLEQLRQAGQSFDAVVCDLRMPGMSGPQLHDVVQAELPHLLPRFLFVSGDLTSSAAREFLARCRVPIVGKPFAAAELVERVREVALAATSVRSTAGDVDPCR